MKTVILKEAENGWTIFIADSKELTTENYVAHDYKEVIEILSKVMAKG